MKKKPRKRSKFVKYILACDYCNGIGFHRIYVTRALRRKSKKTQP